jgi:hypothetical protein
MPNAASTSEPTAAVSKAPKSTAEPNIRILLIGLSLIASIYARDLVLSSGCNAVLGV